ncbi:MAG: Bro-N domain-containing protein [Candidatus Omnitrophica bacterium]|nr:Bro-N domain-containing protein [Candidatus Omnitrophota bacterium]
MKKKLIVFKGQKIRRIWHEKEWFFSVVDVVAALTDSPTPRQYWGKIKDREFKALQLSPIWVQLKLVAEDGKKYATDCANTRSLFRIIQSIPSKKAEPFKRWLAKVGYERVQEIENPELERVKDPTSMPEHKKLSRQGGSVAKKARIDLEKKTRKKIISKDNYLDVPEVKKRIQAHKNE